MDIEKTIKFTNNMSKKLNKKNENYINPKKIVSTKKQDIIKQNLMIKYNFSEPEAEQILHKLNQKINDYEMNNFNEDNIHIEKTQKDENELLIEKQIKRTYETDSIQRIDNPLTLDSNENIYEIPENYENESKISKNDEDDVDEILKGIIPNYNKEISIEIEHVDLIFDVVNDKIDTIKETIIRTLKRNKSKKVKFQALTDITFKIYKGEKVGIIGYNGAGKSTLLNVICGIYPPTRGKVKTNGNISPLLSLGAGFDYNYSGRKNILLNGAVLGYEKKYLESKIDEIIEFTELEKFIDFPIKNYSSGMLAKLGFSIATIVEPDILIIDEILGVGDVNFQKKSSDKIRSLMDMGTTVILVSHSLPQIRELCDKAIWIDKGRVREIGEVNQVCDNYLKDSEQANAEQLKNIQFK